MRFIIILQNFRNDTFEWEWKRPIDRQNKLTDTEKATRNFGNKQNTTRHLINDQLLKKENRKKDYEHVHRKDSTMEMGTISNLYFSEDTFYEFEHKRLGKEVNTYGKSAVFNQRGLSWKDFGRVTRTCRCFHKASFSSVPQM